jgi:hypothetical protein
VWLKTGPGRTLLSPIRPHPQRGPRLP